MQFSMLKRSPIKRHAPKRRPGDVDHAYVEWIKTLPCCVSDCASHRYTDLRKRMPVCELYDTIEAHHAGDHGLSQRAPDRTAISLCVWHHREGPDSLHTLGKHFWAYHGLDRDALIAELNKRYDADSTCLS